MALAHQIADVFGTTTKTLDMAAERNAQVLPACTEVQGERDVELAEAPRHLGARCPAHGHSPRQSRSGGWGVSRTKV